MKTKKIFADVKMAAADSFRVIYASSQTRMPYY